MFVPRLFPPDNTPLRSSLVAEAIVVELFRGEPEEDLGLRIVGGKDTPLGNIVIQEVVRDTLAAADGRLAPGDHILEVRAVSIFVSDASRNGPPAKVDIQEKRVLAPWQRGVVNIPGFITCKQLGLVCCDRAGTPRARNTTCTCPPPDSDPLHY